MFDKLDELGSALKTIKNSFAFLNRFVFGDETTVV